MYTATIWSSIDIFQQEFVPTKANGRQINSVYNTNNNLNFPIKTWNRLLHHKPPPFHGPLKMKRLMSSIDFQCVCIWIKYLTYTEKN